MGGGGVDLVRRAIADVAVQNDQRRPSFGLPEDRKGIFDPLPIIGVANPQHIPPIGEKARRHVFGEGDFGFAFDGDVVVVVDPAQIIELKMTGERGGLGADAFHQAAVAADRIDVVVEDVEAGVVVAVGQPLSCNGHADAHRHALAERAGCRFDARDPVIFRMPRRFAAELAEMFDVVERHRRLADGFVLRIHGLGAGQIEYGPQQHRSVAVGQHEAVAIGPDWVLRIEAQDLVPNRVDQRRQRHRRAGMTGVRLLDGVDRQRADRIDRELVELFVGHATQLSLLHRGCAP